MRFRPFTVSPRPLRDSILPKALRYGRVINWQALEGVHGDENGRPNGNIDVLVGVPLTNCVQQGALIEVTEHKQVAYAIYKFNTARVRVADFLTY